MYHFCTEILMFKNHFFHRKYIFNYFHIVILRFFFLQTDYIRFKSYFDLKDKKSSFRSIVRYLNQASIRSLVKTSLYNIEISEKSNKINYIFKSKYAKCLSYSEMWKTKSNF